MLNKIQIVKILGLALFVYSVATSLTGNAWSVEPAENMSEHHTGTLTPTQCPQNLAALEPEMQKALRYITSTSFRETMLASLQASIPDAIEQSDGLAQQIKFLKKEIVEQEQKRQHAERVAREHAKDPKKPLVPCRRREESSYCYAMDQYYVSTAANLANKAFLEALQCYQQEGMR